MAATILDSGDYNKHIGYRSLSAVDQLVIQLVILSYNLHGLNQGKHGINEIITTIEPDFIMLQDH